MRILLLNQFYPPDTAATGQLLADVAKALVSEGHEVHVICSAGSYSGGRTRAGSPRKQRGVQVHRVGATGLGRDTAVGRLSDWGSYYLLAAKRALQLPRIDVCLALTTPPFIGLVGMAMRRLRGTRLVVWTMDLWPDVAETTGVIEPGGLLSRALQRLARRLYKEAETVISLGRTMTERLTRLDVDADKIRTVHNWVPGEAVSPLPRGKRYIEYGVPLDGQFVVMYSGNMGTPHEFGTILNAAGELAGDSGILFLFAGTGSRRDEVVDEVERRELQNVRFVEPVPLERLAEHLASAEVHLVCMREEAEGCIVPSKTYGIMAAARPGIMIGPRTSEPARLFRASGGGLSLGIGQGEKLASVIRWLRGRPDILRRMGEAGRTYYERKLGRRRGVASVVDAVHSIGEALPEQMKYPDVPAAGRGCART